MRQLVAALLAGLFMAGTISCADIPTDSAHVTASSNNKSRSTSTDSLILIATNGRLQAAVVDELAARHEMRILHRFHFQDALLVRMPSNRIALVAGDPSVKGVTGGAVIRVAGDTRGWGFAGQPLGHGFASLSGLRGAGIKIGIFDSGIDCSHPDFGNQCGYSYDFVGDGVSPYTDPVGHGTAVASVAMARIQNSHLEGAAAAAAPYSFRVINSSGTGSCVSLAAAIDQATFDYIDIMNMSVARTDNATARSQCVNVETSIMHAHGAGFMLVAAAGNVVSIGPDVGLPAAYSFVTAVSGLERTLFSVTFWSGSSAGDEVDISAAGHDIPLSTPVASSTMFGYTGGALRTRSGTSYAAPLVSAAAAILMATYPDSRRQNDAVEAWLQQHAYQVSGHDSSKYGAGVLNIAAAVAAGSPCITGLCTEHDDP